MSRFDDWYESVTPEDYPAPLPVEQDADLLPCRRPFVHTPITHDQLASTIKRAMADAERASLDAAHKANVRGDIPQREVAPGIWQLTRGRVS